MPEAYFLPLRALRRLLPAPRIIMQVSGIIASHYHNTAMYFVSGHRDSSLLQHPDSSLHKYSRILYGSCSRTYFVKSPALDHRSWTLHGQFSCPLDAQALIARSTKLLRSPISRLAAGEKPVTLKAAPRAFFSASRLRTLMPRGRRVSVTELRAYRRKLMSHDQEDSRENLQYIRGGVLAGALRMAEDSRPAASEHAAFVDPLLEAEQGANVLDAIGEFNHPGRLSFTCLLRKTRLLDAFEDECVMAVAKQMVCQQLTQGEQLESTTDCYAVVLSGCVQLSLPRKHAERTREELLYTISHSSHSGRHLLKSPRARAETTGSPGARHAIGQFTPQQVLLSELKEDAEHLKQSDEVCNLYSGDVFRTGNVGLILPGSAEGLGAPSAHSTDTRRPLLVSGARVSKVPGETVMALISTDAFDLCVQQCQQASGRAYGSGSGRGSGSFTLQQVAQHLERVPLFSGIRRSAACTLAQVAREFVHPSTGADAATVRPAFSTGHSRLSEQHVVVRQNAPARSLFLLLSGPATVVFNSEEKFKTTEGIQKTASSRNDEADADPADDLPEDQPSNEHLFESVRTILIDF